MKPRSPNTKAIVPIVSGTPSGAEGLWAAGHFMRKGGELYSMAAWSIAKNKNKRRYT